ncbi:MAG: mechanosensitive ion channel [Planctomycetota bacterium]
MPNFFSLENLKGLLLTAKDKLIDFAPKLAAAVAVVVIGYILARWLRGVLSKALHKAKVDVTLANFLGACLYGAIMVFVLVSAIGQLGVNTSSFIAILGAATFAVGFALQGSLSNFAAGILMILFRPIRNGDLVEAAGVIGTVQEVGVFATVINTVENKRAIVPNGRIMGDNIINFTSNGRLRVDMKFGISYADDMNQAIEIMKKVLAADSRVLKDPAPTVACVEHGDSSVNFVCRPHVKPADYWAVWFDTHKAVKEAFDAAGISIPFPQRDVHMIAPPA